MRKRDLQQPVGAARWRRCGRAVAAFAVLLCGSSQPGLAAEGEKPRQIEYEPIPPAPVSRTRAEMAEANRGCLSCHTQTDEPTMHSSPSVVLACTDCHGGKGGVVRPADVEVGSEAYAALLEKAHVLPRYPEAWHWPSSRTPERTYTLLNRESPEFIRFVNPGDLRVAREACGACHAPIVDAVERSLMATTAMLWGGAAYNNGIVPLKRYALGEAYTRDGNPAQLTGLPGDESAEARRRGRLPVLYPLPAWETMPPADNFRVFERGGRNILSIFPETGIPNRLEEPGRPDIRQSRRGPGTGSRVSIPVLNIHKTRLNDPTLWFSGTNDQPGDFRASGCTACHVVYANDRDPIHSGPYALSGHGGKTQTVDPTIDDEEPAHPLRHAFTRAIPTSQCMVCHMHQPNMFLNSYLGYTMWDYEVEAPLMWPEQQRNPSVDEIHKTLARNPEGASVRGKWSDVEFLERVWELSAEAKVEEFSEYYDPSIEFQSRTEISQFADYHGHGWNFRSIQKRDRKGRLLDAAGNVVAEDDEKKFQRAVHLRDIHAEKGMHCVDCHFSRDSHGTGHLHGEVAAAVEIRCQDCHGTIDAKTDLRTTGPAAPSGGTSLDAIRNPDGRLRFEWRDGRLYQRSLLWPGKEWHVPQVRDSVDPKSPDYNENSARAKTMRRDRKQSWGPIPAHEERAHDDSEMACFSCHSSWVTSCAGCHLPIEANRKTTRHHFEGGETRNYATYNPQAAREEMFLLGRHGEVKDYVIAPLRSSSALVVSSTDANRNHIYVQQPPVSAVGYSSQAFNPHFPHTVRKTETKGCEDCHLSANKDNNAIMAQLLGLGTNFVNFVGYNAWVGTERSVEGIQVTEWEEPQAVIGSYLHRHAYPDFFARHLANDKRLDPTDSGPAKHAHRSGPVHCLQLRGEYLYIAEGTRGTRVYDVASIANKNISQRILTAPFSLLGQDIRVESRNATCVALPTNQPVRPELNGGDEARERLMRLDNLEQTMHPIYRYAAVTDEQEGLILVDVTTMGDFEPRNNHLDRAVTFNPDGLLDGARHAAFAGHLLYVVADAGVIVVDLDDPLQPTVLTRIELSGARATALQFRYLFVAGDNGLTVVDSTNPAAPTVVATLPLGAAHRVFVSRTYAYVAAGEGGLVIVDVENPERPRVYSRFTAEGRLADVRDVVVATTNASLFAYVADARLGLAVLQLTSPESQPGLYGFSPEPRPELIAWQPTDAAALAVSRGLERDRAVDESGHQVAVFGRVGSRPFTLEEMKRLYLDSEGKPWFVQN